MKKPLLFALFLSILGATGVFAQTYPDIPNGSFENWDDTGRVNKPTGWDTINHVTRASGIAVTVNGQPETRYSEDGNYSVRLTTTAQGTLANFGVIQSSFPYTDRPEYLTLKYIYLLGNYQSPNQQAFGVFIYMTKWNDTLARRDTILAIGTAMLGGPHYPWTVRSIELTGEWSKTSENPDTAHIRILSSVGQPFQVFENTSLWLDNISFTVGSHTAVEETDAQVGFGSISNYPNPFLGNTTINYAVSAASRVQLSVYDLNGREVTKLVDENKAPGAYQVNFNASGLKPGVYLYTIQSDGYTETRKMIITE
ncbi:MAG: T9SS type A sorting domain-containing protein [Bacteroidota bacterium]|nr:T9SS type A sorting domain-containing protein [Bacteroidota bacterium]